MKTINGLILLSACGLSVNAFAAEATCKAVNKHTGEAFFANGYAEWPKKALKKAGGKAMWKCHNRSEGWSGHCYIKHCKNNYNDYNKGHHNKW
ncbi:Uncharacterised protein [Legionella beliardensis]|uniref:Uncharacterized protein n=1 Tax=Legionella beliardensis TaxID=91822 RepID=A0A378I365_9GAMM|nr:hypothetical protein [Legionella beliardensis]STX29619.1 Uncharacterised protein [Legionella beliardensis]